MKHKADQQLTLVLSSFIQIVDRFFSALFNANDKKKSYCHLNTIDFKYSMHYWDSIYRLIDFKFLSHMTFNFLYFGVSNLLSFVIVLQKLDETIQNMLTACIYTIHSVSLSRGNDKCMQLWQSWPQIFTTTVRQSETIRSVLVIYTKDIHVNSIYIFLTAKKLTQFYLL